MWKLFPSGNGHCLNNKKWNTRQSSWMAIDTSVRILSVKQVRFAVFSFLSPHNKLAAYFLYFFTKANRE